ncbi:MAG TPA: hypothetical protein VKS24_18035 [Bradyrhizobium sp.]|nr:hypothetical protein [Bradyrhizobium sp.]
MALGAVVPSLGAVAEFGFACVGVAFGVTGAVAATALVNAAALTGAAATCVA